MLVERPVAADWTARAQTILAAEGVILTKQQVDILLNGFQGSARELIELLEDYTLTFKRRPLNLQTTTAPAHKPCGIKVLPGKTLINGHSLTNAQGVKK